MPKYYFDFIENGELSKDLEGQTLGSDYEAHRQAVQAIAEVAAEEIPRDGKLDLCVVVADEDHRILFRTKVSFEPG